MKRSAEKALSIIGAVFTVLSIVTGFVSLWVYRLAEADPAIRTEIEALLMGDETISSRDRDLILSLLDMFGAFILLITIGLIISLILTIVGIVSIWNDKNPKLAGVMFIIGGLLAGLLSLTSILLYIAGILCFTRKPPLIEDSRGLADDYDGSMRPL